MKAYRLLLVEDHEALALVSRDALMDAGYEVVLASTVHAAEKALYEQNFHMILLDINLPDETGFSFCQKLRKTYDLPVLFISARTTTDDKCNAFMLGGDDYLPKPYALAELVARVHAHIRRNYHFLPNMIKQTGPFTIDFQTKTVKKNGKSIALSEKEFAVFTYLVKHSGQCISKEILFAEIWGQASESQDATVSVHIRWLREKLEDDPSHPKFMKTIWGQGYLWEDPA